MKLPLIHLAWSKLLTSLFNATLVSIRNLRCWLGQGTVPLKEIIGALMSAGYAGDFDVELMGQEIETSNYAKLISHAKRTFEGLKA